MGPTTGSGVRALTDPLDAAAWPDEVARLRRCRGRADLDDVLRAGAWLGPERQAGRLKLVKHNNGTWMVVHYLDGWSTRMSMATV